MLQILLESVYKDQEMLFLLNVSGGTRKIWLVNLHLTKVRRPNMMSWPCHRWALLQYFGNMENAFYICQMWRLQCVTLVRELQIKKILKDRKAII